MAPEILPEGMLPEGILLEEMLLRFRITQKLPAMAMSQVKITNWDYVAPGADSGANGSDGSDSAQPDMEVYE